MKELVSVLVPVYNAERFLQQCVDSLLHQTYANIEIVLVDDGSTDESGNICDEYAMNDNRVKVVHKANAGVSEARITAFENSRGSYIAFVDADDYVATNYIEAMLKAATEHQADIVSCNLLKVNGNRTIKESHSMEGLYDRQQIREALQTCLLYDKQTRTNGMTIYLWSKLIRREYVAKGLEYGRGIWFGEDQIALFCMLYEIERLYVMQDRLYYYVQHEAQVTRRYNQSMWLTNIECWKRYRMLDREHLIDEQLNLRIWKSINRIVFQRMTTVVDKYKDFRSDMIVLREHEEMKRFFSQGIIRFGFKENIKYWMLKYRMFWLYYVCLYRWKIQK